MIRRHVTWIGFLALGIFTAACDGQDPLEKAKALQQAGRFEDSRKILEELVQKRREDPDVHFWYGMSLYRTNRQSQSVWPLRRAMEDPNWKIAAATQLAAAALETANFDEAVELATAVLEDEPDHSGALMIRSLARVHTRRDYEGALADADRYLERDPENLRVLSNRAVALLALEQTDEAAVALEALELATNRGVVPEPAAPSYCGARAKFAEETGAIEEAERVYRSCLEQYPANELVLMKAVEFFDALGKHSDATLAMRHAHETAPHSRELRVQLALRLDRRGDSAGAESLLRHATKNTNPVLAATALADLAGYAAEKERFDEAVAAYESAMNTLPASRDRLLFPYTDTLIRAGRAEEALELATSLRVPAERYLVEGRAHLELDNLEHALERFGQGIELWPNQPVARYYAGITAARLGRVDRAIEEFRYAIRAGAASDARIALARLYQAEGEIKTAITIIRHNSSREPLDAESALVEMELLASLAPGKPSLRPVLQPKKMFGRTLAAFARGVRLRAGPAAAAESVLEAQNLDLAAPESREALAGLVDHLIAANHATQALDAIESVLRTAPDDAELLALHGDSLAATDAHHAANTRFAQALALEADQARALRGEARRIAATGDREAAIMAYDRAVAAEIKTKRADPGVALALADLADEAHAIATLESWLMEHPFDAKVTLRLGSLLRNSDAERARHYARIALRFGARDEAKALLAVLQSGER